MQEETFDLPPPRKKRFTVSHWRHSKLSMTNLKETMVVDPQFQSYEQSLKSVQLPSATAPTTFDDELDVCLLHYIQTFLGLSLTNREVWIGKCLAFS